MPFLSKFSSLFKFYSEKDKRLFVAISRISGGKPYNLHLYKLAIRHASATDGAKDAGKNHNERLEYLGDAILGAVIAEFLFKKFPYKDEGFLTEIRSRIVNRESLNTLAQKIGLTDLIEFDSKRKGHHTHKSMYGDALEALVGAVYLDKGFDFCRTFVLDKLIAAHYDLDQVIQADFNYKSRLIEWAQKEGRPIRFEIVQEEGTGHVKEFIAQVFIDNTPISTGKGFSKKKAEQAAASKTLDMLKLNPQLQAQNA